MHPSLSHRVLSGLLPTALALAAAVVLVSAARPAPAHDTPVPQLCLDSGRPPTILAQFEFQPFELDKYARTHQAYDLTTFTPCTSTTSRMPCGIVDDWHWAAQMAAEFCGGPAGPQRSISPPGVAVTAPAVFNDPLYHHRDYGFSLGLKGVCYTCPTLQTTAPERAK
jgi:hypothetical protein